MILLENLCNRLPGLGALVIWEETPSSLPVSCPSDDLPQFTRKYCVMIAPCHGLVLLLSSTGALLFLDDPSTSTSPTRPVWTPFHQRSTLLVIWDQIYLDLRTPRVFMRRTWVNKGGLSELHVLKRNSRHSAARMAMNQRPTKPEGMVYQLYECAVSRRH